MYGALARNLCVSNEFCRLMLEFRAPYPGFRSLLASPLGPRETPKQPGCYQTRPKRTLFLISKRLNVIEVGIAVVDELDMANNCLKF